MAGKKGVKWKTESSRERLSVSMIGNTNQEKKRSLETKRKIAQAMIGNKNTFGKKYGEETRERDRIAKMGEKNPAWNGGSSFEPYCHEFNAELKKQIVERDSCICQLCGTSISKNKPHVHHIDYDKKNSVLNNLITLCNSCHSLTNYRREDFIELFSWMMQRLEFFNMLNKATIQHPEFAIFDRTKNFQDQLQEMRSWDKRMTTREILETFSVFIGFERAKYYDQFTSMEQLWLAFVMYELFNKVWNSEDWIETAPTERVQSELYNF